MYVLPQWDLIFAEEIKNIGHPFFYLSGTMVEPLETGNPCVVVADYGNDLNSFDESRLLNDFQNFNKPDWYGATWPPSVMHRDVWDLIGGFSLEFSPGMYSDPDISMKLWLLGVRYFKGCGKSLVYHFGSKTTKRIKVNRGAALFYLKWGIGSSTFTKKVLQRGRPFQEPLLPDSNLEEQGIKYFTKRISALLNMSSISKQNFWERFK
jgi:hypothetical protein